MGVPAFQFLIGDLRTGKITTRLPVQGGSWQQAPINGAGSLSGFTINAASRSLGPVDLYHATAPGKAFLAVQYDQTILNAGPIWTRHYTRSSATLTLGAAGLWSLFDHRLVVPVLAEPLAPGTVQAATTTYPTSSNMSLGDIARALVQQAMGHVGGNLPLVLPASQGLTPGATRTYPGYDLSALGAMLTEITGVLNGPEIRLVPQYKPGDPTSIQWVMEVGTPAAPLLVQGGADWVFDASVPQSVVSEIDYDEDATAMGTRAWEVGAGSQAGAVISQADSTTLTSVGYPLLEVVDRSHNSDANQADLDGYAAAYLAQHNRPSSVWKVKVRNDGAPGGPHATQAGPRLGSYAVGDYCQVIVAQDPFLSPPTRTRMVGDVFSDTWSDIWPGTVQDWPWPPQAHRARIVLVEGDADPGYETTLTLATTLVEV